MTAVASFFKYLSLEEFSRLYHLSQKEGPRQDSLTPWQQAKNILEGKLKQYIKDNDLMTWQGALIHKTWFLKKMQEKREEGPDLLPIASLVHKLFFESTYVREKSLKPILAQRYYELVKKIEGGNFDHDYFMDMDKCFECGAREKIAMKNWKILPEPGQAVTPCIPDITQEMAVEFTGGELLVSDCLRLNPLVNAMKSLEEREKIDLSKGQDVIKRSKLFWEELGFIIIQVGNTNASIFGCKGGLMGGHLPEEYENKIKGKIKDLGSISTDLWAVSIIETHKLQAIMGKSPGGLELMEKYLKEENVLRIPIRPGKAIVKFHHNHERFAGKAEKLAINPGPVEPYFVIEGDFYGLHRTPKINKTRGRKP